MKTHKDFLIVLAGGTGYLGEVLIKYLRPFGYRFAVLTRTPDKQKEQQGVEYFYWDGEQQGTWIEVLEGAAAVINLAGKSVNCRYTYANRWQIIKSRVMATLVLGRAVAACNVPPRVWINASSAAYYGNTGEKLVTEASDSGKGFSAGVVRDWERAFWMSETPEVRRVCLRLGLVFGKKGGAYPAFRKLALSGWGGGAGNGLQYIPWLHEADWARLIDWLIRSGHASGTYNVAAPDPVTNRALLKGIADTMRMPLQLRMPEKLVRFGARVAGTEAELLLHGRRMLPERLQGESFSFLFGNIQQALAALEKPSPDAGELIPAWHKVRLSWE